MDGRYYKKMGKTSLVILPFIGLFIMALSYPLYSAGYLTKLDFSLCMVAVISLILIVGILGVYYLNQSNRNWLKSHGKSAKDIPSRAPVKVYIEPF